MKASLLDTGSTTSSAGETVPSASSQKRTGSVDRATLALAATLNSEITVIRNLAQMGLRRCPLSDMEGRRLMLEIERAALAAATATYGALASLSKSK